MFRYQGEERGVHAYHRTSSSTSVHGFLGAGEHDRPLERVWRTVCQLSKIHMFNQSVRSVWTRPLDDSTQLGEQTCLFGPTKQTVSSSRYCWDLQTMSNGTTFQELVTEPEATLLVLTRFPLCSGSVYILTDPSSCHLSQPRDFCCLSTQSRQVKTSRCCWCSWRKLLFPGLW